MERYSAEKRIYQDKTVLIVEDIIRSGITLHWLRDFFLDSMGVKRLMIATLLYVKGSRFPKNLLDYLGFEVDDEYYIGYGLDHLGKYRNFDFITTLHEAK
jgi:hypoxanthine phosphoribosyltransferase